MMKEKEDWLFESNNMLLNCFWNKQAREKEIKNVSLKADKLNIKITDNTSDTEKLIFNIISIGTMIFPFITFGICGLYYDNFYNSNFVIKISVLIINVLAIFFIFAWIFEPLFLGTFKLANIIDDIATKISKKFR